MSGEFDKVTRQGHTLFRRDWALIEASLKAAGVSTYVIQGGWNRGGVAQSAGTHDGGSVFDLSVRNLTEAQAIKVIVELRRRNCAAYLRSPKYGWPAHLSGSHIHATVIDGPQLAGAAAQQNTAFLAGRNALASRLPDPFPRPSRAPFHIGGAPAVSHAVTATHHALLSNLHSGAHNNDVKLLQQALHITPVDGIFGPQTEHAVRNHQVKMGLHPDPAGHVFVGPKQGHALKLI